MKTVFCADKPYGISSHQVDRDKPGFVEWLSEQKQTPVYLCHRLDKTTTGCLVVTTAAKDCAEVTTLWQTGSVEKIYWLITDSPPQQSEWTTTSLIEKKGNQWVSDPLSASPNSSTRFRCLKQAGSFFLVEARPLTGKTHQIRLHAQDSQIPLLGDSLYGGTPFPLMFLHCSQIRSESFEFRSEAPWIYQNLENLKNPRLCRWLMSYDRRKRLYPERLNGDQCVRLIHSEDTPLRVDLLGSVAHAGWWDDTPPEESDLQSLHDFFKIIDVPQWSLQNYGKSRDVKKKLLVNLAPDSWLAYENNMAYEFTQTVGAAPGLFLDQRNHRSWVQKNSKNKRVLNLFAYTGGFSLNAAQGGASQVITVDLSPKYKKWSQKNFALNQLQSPHFKFYDMDSFEYLKYAQKKALLFDLILCDPPSFSQGGKGRFQIDKDFAKLIQMTLDVLSPRGSLLFSTNYEQWSWPQWRQKILSLNLGQNIEILDNFSMQWDFDWHQDRAQMKAFHLRKK